VCPIATTKNAAQTAAREAVEIAQPTKNAQISGALKMEDVLTNANGVPVIALIPLHMSPVVSGTEIPAWSGANTWPVRIHYAAIPRVDVVLLTVKTNVRRESNIASMTLPTSSVEISIKTSVWNLAIQYNVPRILLAISKPDLVGVLVKTTAGGELFNVSGRSVIVSVISLIRIPVPNGHHTNYVPPKHDVPKNHKLVSKISAEWEPESPVVGLTKVVPLTSRLPLAVLNIRVQ
jgi:hypothetical protein